MSDLEDGHGQDGNEVVEFGWESTQPLGGRRKKAHDAAKKKNKPGTFGKAWQRAMTVKCLYLFRPRKAINRSGSNLS